LDKTGLEDEECRFLIDALLSAITIIPRREFDSYLPRAHQIMTYIDEDDTPFLALALSFRNDGIWSEDKDFHRQNEVRIWKTRDLLDML
jgi:predicted nucleic acid-binding protein